MEKPALINPMRRRVIRFFIILVILAGLIGGVAGAKLFQSTTETPNINKEIKTQVIISEESALTKVAEEASPAVVSIVREAPDLPEDLPLIGETADGLRAIGSGFIISSSGLIITNSHVVDNPSSTYFVVTKGKKTFPILKVDHHKNEDIAVVYTNISGLPTIKLGDSDTLKPGQRVVTIGTILGKLDSSVSSGVISALDRGIVASDEDGGNPESLSNVIQVDVPLNPGNSGGPLLNLAGEAVGVTFAITENATNVGFAIPINIVKDIIRRLPEGANIL